ncbi:MAG: radical SAM protein [Chitinivibrionales bacterium]|nr:radical SAM protein [Chitinivibrionales bacterium]
MEFTLQCNLKCAYCNYTTSQYRAPGKEIDPLALEAIINDIIEHKPSGVCVTGRGETTLYKNWHRCCDRLLDENISLGMITNLAKEFSVQELETLSRFSTIEASCDTADPALFRELRRGNTQERFLKNMDDIRATAARAGRKGPAFIWSCVVCDKTVFGLVDFVRFGLQHGVRGFNLNGYVQGNFSSGLKPILEMAPDDFIRASNIINELVKRLSNTGIHFHVVEGLIDKMNEKLIALSRNSPELSHPAADRETLAVQEGPLPGPAPMTRACLDPWLNCIIQADGGVFPCCAYQQPLSMLSAERKLHQAYNSDEMITLRNSLLTGNLKPWCFSCPVAGQISVREFSSHLERTLGIPPVAAAPPQLPVAEAIGV